MPTRNRRVFVPWAIDYFRRQDYPRRELIVVDDGDDCVADLIIADPRIRYLRVNGPCSVGTKRNLACEQATGQIIVHWDDDDWMADRRIGGQIAALREADADICGFATLVFYQPGPGRAWQYRYPAKDRQLVAGGSLCYWKRVWREGPFADVNLGEDARFVWGEGERRIVGMDHSGRYVALTHAANTNPRKTNGPRWSPYPVDKLRAIMGEDFGRYG